MASYHSLSKNVSLMTAVEDKLYSCSGYTKSAVSLATAQNRHELGLRSILCVLKGQDIFSYICSTLVKHSHFFPGPRPQFTRCAGKAVLSPYNSLINTFKSQLKC